MPSVPAGPQALLCLHVPDERRADRESGGWIRRIADCTWDEMAVTFNNQPLIAGVVLDEIDAVAQGKDVYFDVTTAIVDDDQYCFAVDCLSSDGVDYDAKATTEGQLVFIVDVAP